MSITLKGISIDLRLMAISGIALAATVMPGL